MTAWELYDYVYNPLHICEQKKKKIVGILFIYIHLCEVMIHIQAMCAGVNVDALACIHITFILVLM